MILLILLVAVVSKLLLDFYLKTRSGYLLRAVGDNEVLVTSLAKDKGNVKILGLAISNGLVALAGSVFCQQQGVFDISSGTGSMVIGLASVIVGTMVEKKSRSGGISGSINIIRKAAMPLPLPESFMAWTSRRP